MKKEEYRKPGSVFGIDISPRNLDQAFKNLSIKLSQIPSYCLPEKESGFSVELRF